MKGALSAYANAAERRRGASLARAAMQETPLRETLGERFYQGDMYAAIDLIMARRHPHIYKRHADLVEGFGEPYNEVASELAYAAFMLGAMVVGVHLQGARMLTEPPAAPADEHAGGAR